MPEPRDSQATGVGWSLRRHPSRAASRRAPAPGSADWRFSERIAGRKASFVHDFLTGETWCPSITPTDGTVIVDFGIAAVSGDAAAFAFTSGETVAGSGGTRILGAGLVMVLLATGDVLGTLASADLSFCCGGPPAIAGRTLVWGPYRKAGLDYFDPFPDALPATVVTPGRFAPGTAKYFGPALSGDSRKSPAYGVEGHDIQTGATLGDLYVFYR